MKNSHFSQYDIKIEIGKYGRSLLSRMEEYGFWILYKRDLHIVVVGFANVVLGCIIVRFTQALVVVSKH